MSCNNNVNRPVNKIPDRAVVYTGPEVPSLSLCPGDYLDEVEAAIINRLTQYSTGLGIVLDDVDVTQCDFLDSFIECCIADKSLTGLINAILKGMCSIDGSISSINTVINNIGTSLNYSIQPGCLTVANTKIDTVLNALISQYCAFVTKVTTIFGSLDNPVFNQTLINQIADTTISAVFNNIKGCSPTDITKTGTGVNTQLTINGIIPVGAMISGKWDASYFDNTGLGLPIKGMCGWAVCNGQNGTDDWRGFTPAMATNISSANALNIIVDPTANGDADIATNIGDIKGKTKVKLTAAQSALAPHVHPIVDPGHIHIIGSTQKVYYNDDSAGNASWPIKNDTTFHLGSAFSHSTQSASTNISVGANAGADAISVHENRQPTRYVNFIQRIS